MWRLSSFIGTRMPVDGKERAVQRVLQSHHMHEALGLTRPFASQQRGAVADDVSGNAVFGAAEISRESVGGIASGGDDAETRLIPTLHGQATPEVLHAFIRTAAEVHPSVNPNDDAALALQWVAEAFRCLCASSTPSQRDDFQRDSAVDGGGAIEAHMATTSSPIAASSLPVAANHSTPSSVSLPLAQRECSTTFDQATRIFCEAVIVAFDSLSLHDLSVGGLDRRTTDSLLRSLYVLHLLRLQGNADGRDKFCYDSVLYGGLAANGFLAGLARILFAPASATRRWRAERVCSTTVAVMGSLAFGGACRLRRLMHPNGRESRDRDHNSYRRGGAIEQRVALLGMDGLDALMLSVNCPLCRCYVPSASAIRNVRAGDTVPTCCVCTETHSSVCLPCGHLCLCEYCFEKLPRKTGNH
eukprot:TRINITY_DN18420_c0_g1_i1.p1 TRINITY_DN18420_c0_g1~~TRINITY_DN18420_c0_g1_i1.p1  ORF type:complete len:415 (+),score=57.54 TRINITY_DN18420_c0_g1_i1:224-1468(+)